MQQYPLPRTSEKQITRFRIFPGIGHTSILLICPRNDKQKSSLVCHRRRDKKTSYAYCPAPPPFLTVLFLFSGALERFSTCGGRESYQYQKGILRKENLHTDADIKQEMKIIKTINFEVGASILHFALLSTCKRILLPFHTSSYVLFLNVQIVCSTFM